MIKDIETQQIELAKLETNKGQVEGIKKNPRNIRHEDFEKLKKSISDPTCCRSVNSSSTPTATSSLSFAETCGCGHCGNSNTRQPRAR